MGLATISLYEQNPIDTREINVFMPLTVEVVCYAAVAI